LMHRCNQLRIVYPGNDFGTRIAKDEEILIHSVATGKSRHPKVFDQ
jgi:hypothetical protein